MLLSNKILIKIFSKNLKFYNDKGYNCNVGETIEIKVLDLPNFSRYKVEVMCDNCKKTKMMNYCDFYVSNKNNKYYCSKCRSIRIKETNNLKYGVDNVFQLNDIKNKSKKTNIEKYGCEHHTQNDEIKKKKIETNKKTYGTSYATQNNDVKNKIIKTCRVKYDKDYSFLNEIVKEKIKETLNEKYGESNAMKSNIVKKKALNTRIKNLLKKYEKLNIIKIENNIYEFKCDCDCDHNFEIEKILLYNRIKYKTKICTVCNPINSYSVSGMEIEFHQFLKNIFLGEIITKNRNLISPQELDFYLPELKIAFEFNGLYWHNELYKSNDYHLKKTEECEKQGIHLIHVFEDDWIYKQDIVKSRIMSLLCKSEKIYARKCEIKEIKDNKLVKDFLETNHLQGYIGAKVKLGLYFEEKLVSLMTFGNLRKSMGKKSSHNTYELIRFCNELNVNIIGGASKLLKYFVKNYKPEEIISYADRSWSQGNLYKKLGFEFVCKTRPNYYYVIDGHKKYRFSFRKDILVKNGYDPKKSEHQIMNDRKIYRIYDSGHLKFFFKLF